MRGTSARSSLLRLLPQPKNNMHSNPSAATTSVVQIVSKDKNTARNHSINNNDKTNNEDPFNFRQRYIARQSFYFEVALTEIRQGQKQGCWLWFILPTAPYIVNGVERGSSMNRYFALRGGDACVKAYLRFRDSGINLRANYLMIVHAIWDQLQDGRSLSVIFGSVDLPKVISSLTLFQRIAAEMNDLELVDACQNVLDFEMLDSDRTIMKKKSKKKWFKSSTSTSSL